MNRFIDLIYPPRCPVCDRPVALFGGKEGFCPSCFQKLSFVGRNRCYKCGRGLRDKEREYCPDCQRFRTQYSFDRGMALLEYDEAVRSAIYRLKYEGRREYADVFGTLMAKRFGGAALRCGADGIIPVPLHKDRMRMRGYNQAEVLANAFSKQTGIPVYKDYVKRVTATAPMKNLSPAKRQKNLENAFKIGRNDVKSDITIVMDDIYTTGATVNAIGRVLKAEGVKRVYVLSMAIGAEI